jgi:hypothetical protein
MTPAAYEGAAAAPLSTQLRFSECRVQAERDLSVSMTAHF